MSVLYPSYNIQQGNASENLNSRTLLLSSTLAVALAEGLELDSAIRWAAAAGALAVTKTGAQDSMPYRHEVERLLTSKQGG